MSASIIPLPTAAREPVKQHKRRGRYPKGVVCIRDRGYRREPRPVSIAWMFGRITAVYDDMSPERQRLLFDRIRKLLEEAQAGD